MALSHTLPYAVLPDAVPELWFWTSESGQGEAAVTTSRLTSRKRLDPTCRVDRHDRGKGPINPLLRAFPILFPRLVLGLVVGPAEAGGGGDDVGAVGPDGGGWWLAARALFGGICRT